MRLLYTLGALMFIGLLLLAVSTYKVFNEAQKVGITAGAEGQPGQPAPQDEDRAESRLRMRVWVGTSYLGMAMFVIGGVGGLIVSFQLITRRF